MAVRNTYLNDDAQSNCIFLFEICHLNKRTKRNVDMTETVYMTGKPVQAG